MARKTIPFQLVSLVDIGAMCGSCGGDRIKK
jgi:hypothetical protein